MSDSAVAVETWRQLPGFGGRYSVSSHGRVRSESFVTRNKYREYVKPARILAAGSNKAGYPEVGLTTPQGNRVTRMVHRLVLEAFVGPRPAGFHGCHNDGDAANNRLENLRWDTPRANAADALAHGDLPFGERAPWAKLTADQVRAIRADHRTQPVIAAQYGVTPSAISRIKTRDIWKSI